ncbi:hypothetical protein Bca4012_099828 [Brassica carinata]
METYVDAIGVDTEATTTMGKHNKKKLKVMVAMDESKNSFYALEWAVEHLRDVISAEPETDQAGGLLTLVHVHPTYLQYIYPSGGTGDPKEMICQAVEQTHVDLLVVGSRGLGMIKRVFLGSVSDYCAQHAKCPILIVRPPRETATSSSTKEQRANQEDQVLREV